MNLYKGTFYFNGEWQFFDFTSDMLANAALEHTDDILAFICEDDNQIMGYKIYSKGEEYEVTFSANPRFVSIYNVEILDENGNETEESGRIVEKDIPWLLLSVTNEKEKKEIYNLADNI